jgi:hypothetical protein
LSANSRSRSPGRVKNFNQATKTRLNQERLESPSPPRPEFKLNLKKVFKVQNEASQRQSEQ